MSKRTKEYIEIKDALRGALPEQGAGAACDGAAYRQARAHVIEACSRGLVRLRVA